MLPEFSEFSFAYALTESFMLEVHKARSGLSAFSMPWAGYPVFPTTRKEKKVGYDVEIKSIYGPVFLQFKLCHGIVRNSAREISRHRLHIATPFLRMHLMPRARSNQHQILLDWQNKNHRVYYAAPRYYEDVYFSKYYADHRIIYKSAFITPSGIGPINDNRPHTISFEPSKNYGWFLSEPRRVKIFFGSEIARYMAQQGQKSTVDINYVLENLQQFLDERGIDRRYTGIESPYAELSTLSITHLGALPIFIYRIKSDG